MAEHSGKPSYIPDIDGLRAIAVLSVVLFHISFSLVPGGFVGVDIFFVISGFLITKIIATEIVENRFSFKAFYVRRIRRILPVFFLVAIATLFAGKLLLLPEDWRSLLASVKYALRFGANIFFSKEHGYFDLAADEKPLLHTWSLSIEEQYYFIWPLLLIGLYAIGHKVLKQEKKINQTFTIVCTMGMIGIGFMLAQKLITTGESQAKQYFLLQSRFGELMIGSLSAMLPQISHRKIINVASISGLTGILLALCLIDKQTTFPGYSALLPCLATSLLIYASQSKEFGNGIVSKLLRLPPMVYLGVLSYSIYLWHWPILAYMRYVYGSYALPWQWNLSALLLTFVLSAISYAFLEKKVKRAAITFRTAILVMFVTPSALIFFYSTAETKAVAVLPKNERLATYGYDVCHDNFDSHCLRGDAEKSPRILMMGDSHAAALNSFIDVVGKKEHWSAEVVSASSCSPVFGFDVSVLPEYARKSCMNLMGYVSQNFQKYDAIFIASYWAFHLGMTGMPSDKAYLQKFKHTILELAKSKPVYVFADVPALAISPVRLLHFEDLNLEVKRTSSDQSSVANATIKNIVDSVPNAHWIEMAPAMRDLGKNGIYQGLPMYMDQQHLNAQGSATVGRLFSASQKLLGVGFIPQ